MRTFFVIFVLFWLTACATTTTVDEYRSGDQKISIGNGDNVVLLGRRDSGDYETDAEFVKCVGSKLQGPSLSVLQEQDFMNALYPWLEPRTAPKALPRMRRLMQEPLIEQSIRDKRVRYFVWLDGATKTIDKAGSISCAAGPGGAGCFGFAKWDKSSIYEAIVWDIDDLSEVARVRVDSEGTSYLIGAIAPIPLMTPVKNDACTSLSNQLSNIFHSTE